MLHFPFLKTTFLAGASCLVVAVCFCLSGASLHGLGPAQSSNSNSPDSVLSGRVTSQAEGEMEGVLVTAKGEGSSVAVTVVTDNGGRYAFPRSRLQPGPYRISIRAVGYDLEDPGTVEIRAGSTQNMNLRLRDTRDLASQLSNVEWLLSVPGTEQQRNALGSCVGCHSIALAVKSTHDDAAWRSVLHRMRNYASPSFWLNPIKWPWEVPPRAGDADLADRWCSSG